MSLIISQINPLLIRLRFALLSGILFLGSLALFQLLLTLFSVELRISGDIAGTLVPFLLAACISLTLFMHKQKAP